MEPFSWWEKEFAVVNFSDVGEETRGMSRRAWAVEQGWNELAAFYVDRALNWYKKPPASGRVITNKELYANDNRFWSVVKRMLPTYDIPVCLIAWYPGMDI